MTEYTDTAAKSMLVASGVHEQKPITIQSGAGALVRGTVLGRISASYEYNQLAPAAGDGNELACMILVDDVDATAAAVKAQGFGLGKFRLSDLVWPVGISDAQKKSAITQLQDRGILVDEDFV